MKVSSSRDIKTPAARRMAMWIRKQQRKLLRRIRAEKMGIKPASGKALDKIGEHWGVYRRTRRNALGFKIREKDRDYRRRILEFAQAYTQIYTRR